MSKPLADGEARNQALDPRRSFIVQAPAGSGKTGLLTLRFLKLLALVKQPEEVVAITFTRKAAAEMKSRILAAIANATKSPPGDPFAKQTWDLANGVVKRGLELNWGLLDNPGRLRILTIDSLCATISRQMPILSRLGGPPAITTEPQPIYLQAARTTLDHIDEEGERGAAVRILLDHLDNNLSRAESLLADMLAKRDQWLRHVAGRRGNEIRSILENSLQSIVITEVGRLPNLLEPQLLAEIFQLAQEAAKQLQITTGDTGILTAWLNNSQLPEDTLAAVEPWQGIAQLLLTLSGSWRKSFNVKIGFPAQSVGKNPAEKTALKKHKARASALIADLEQNETFRQALHEIRSLPPLNYDERQWQILSALFTLLPVAAAHLQVLFSQGRAVDYTGVSQSAIQALGDSDRPTDLALKLDYQISHLLVDEFQDTSRMQFELVARLIAGWDEEGGNTLFLVGDPMQSIYRFREAEVGLFLKARNIGIPPVKLTPLTLKVNFRSEAGIVNWVNNAMDDIFPLKENISVGAVTYSDSIPFHPVGQNQAVTIHPQPAKDTLAEAGQVAKIAYAARQQGLSVAVLVRARGHLARILPAFIEAGLQYQAVEVHHLSEQPMIQDLLALTRALSHPADRIAWLAILRAPWCGLSLADLHTLVTTSTAKSATVWQMIVAPDVEARVSADGQKRLLRFREVLSATLQQRGRGDHFSGAGGWRRWVEGCWLALGGPATLIGDGALADAKTFFDLLESAEEEGGSPDIAILAANVQSLYSATDPLADPDLTVMTLHKAKGLEFDVVILPGLDRPPRGESSRLLSWLDVDMDERADALPILAPIGRSDEDGGDAIQNYIKTVDKQKAGFETARLLYVALTRAKKQLHLLAGTIEEDKNPPPGSFLATLWPVLQEQFTHPVVELVDPEPQAGGAELIATPLTALRADWQLPKLPEIISTAASTLAPKEEQVLFDWAGDTARLVGLVVHRYLSRIADAGVANWSAQKVEAQQDAIAAHLKHLGVPPGELSQCINKVKTSLQKTLADQRGRWLLDANHTESRSEHALSSILSGKRARFIIDRSFIDANGNRWIVDYKTSMHLGGDLEGFLDNERVRYQTQLDRYARLFATMEERPIFLGLYFPMLSAWREWQYGE